MRAYKSQRNTATLLRVLLSCTSISYPGCAPPLGPESLYANSTCGESGRPSCRRPVFRGQPSRCDWYICCYVRAMPPGATNADDSKLYFYQSAGGLKKKICVCVFFLLFPPSCFPCDFVRAAWALTLIDHS